MSEIDVRKGMPSTKLSREEFDRRFRSRFTDPAFEPLEAQISAMTATAWDGYTNSRKSPPTRKAGAGLPIRTTTLRSTGSTRVTRS